MATMTCEMNTNCANKNWNNMFLQQLNTELEDIVTRIEAVSNEMADDYCAWMDGAVMNLEDLQDQIREDDNDCQACANPSDGDCDPGDFLPGDLQDLLEKLYKGSVLGYINIPETMMETLRSYVCPWCDDPDACTSC